MYFKRAIFSLVFMLIGAVLALQIKAVLGAEASDPITSPITSPIGGTPTPTPTPTPNPVNGGSNNSNSNSNNNSNNNHNDSPSHSSASSPVCGSEKPTNKPALLAALLTGTRQVTLYWTKVAGPGDHYVISYGLKSNQADYGVSNVGNIETTKFTVSDLNVNTRYYFRIEAANGCMPGDFSNEVSVVVSPKGSYVPSSLNFAVLGDSAINNSATIPAEYKKEIHKNPKSNNDNRIIISTKKTGFTLFGFLQNFFFHK